MLDLPSVLLLSHKSEFAEKVKSSMNAGAREPTTGCVVSCSADDEPVRAAELARVSLKSLALCLSEGSH